MLASAGSWGGDTKEGVSSQVNLIATNSATFYLTGVQLEAGISASPYENKSFEKQIAACQRYFFSLGGTASYEMIAQGMFFNTTTVLMKVDLPVKMRAGPSITTVNSFLSKVAGANLATASISVDQAGTQTLSFTATVSGGTSTAGYAAIMFANNSTDVRFQLSAEL